MHCTAACPFFGADLELHEALLFRTNNALKRGRMDSREGEKGKFYKKVAESFDKK